MSSTTSINPDLLSILAALIAIAISQSRNAGELNVLGNFIISIGSLIVTEAAQIETQKAKQASNDQIKNIEWQIKQLEKQLNQLKSG